MKNLIFTFIYFFFLFTPLSAQLVGGSGNGQSAPSKIEASTISAGAYSGDVSLFTGTYSSSYSLGSVACPAGLSYNLSLSYSSSFTSGDNLPLTSGIPYGEGWNLDIPMISVDVEEYKKYTNHDEFVANIGSSRSGFECDEVSEEGQLHWFNPTLNIPGVASGRMIYRGNTNRGELQGTKFVMHKFDRYIEAVLIGNNWEITLDDGTVYHFYPKPSYRQATNQRIDVIDDSHYDGCTADDIATWIDTLRVGPEPIWVTSTTGVIYDDRPYLRDSYDEPITESITGAFGNPAIKNLFLPKVEILSWYCVKITNPQVTGSINFTYEGFGKDIDYFDVYKQKDIVDFVRNTGIRGSISPSKTSTDIFLKEISACSEKLVLNYDELDIEGMDDGSISHDEEILKGLKNGDENLEVVDLDGLYKKVLVYDSDWDNNDGWHRYIHGFSNEADWVHINAGCPDPTNPYRATDEGFSGNPMRYYRKETNSLNFDHAYLESPKLNGFIPGETYQIETNIVGNSIQPCLFDINVVTGLDNDIQETLVGGLKRVTPEDYEPTISHEIYSTFNKGAKWYHHGDNINDTPTSDFFVMPHLPPQLKGVQFQVGPANSDNNHAFAYESNENPASLLPGGPIQPTYWERQGGTQDSYNPAGKIRYGFGGGYPWHMLFNLYNLYGTDEAPVFRFWHTTRCDGLSGTGENIPTGSEGLSLSSFKVYRIVKKVLVLKSVEKFIFNPGQEIDFSEPDTGWNSLGGSAFEHEYESFPKWIIYQSCEDDPSNCGWHNGGTYPALTAYPSTEHFRYSFKLAKIIQFPKTGISNAVDSPTTYFSYIKPEDLYPDINPMGNNEEQFELYNNSALILNEIIDPLGKKTTIEYDGYYSLAKQVSPPPYQNSGEISEGYPWQIKLSGASALHSSFPNHFALSPGFVRQYYMRVKNKQVEDNNGMKCWRYEFSGGKGMSQLENIGIGFNYTQKTILHENLFTGNIAKPDLSLGYANTIVYGPTSSCDDNPFLRTEYTHDTSRLLWGKLTKTRSYNQNDNIVSLSTVEYEPVLAFESPFHNFNQISGPDYQYFDPDFYINNSLIGDEINNLPGGNSAFFNRPRPFDSTEESLKDYIEKINIYLHTYSPRIHSDNHHDGYIYDSNSNANYIDCDDSTDANNDDDDYFDCIECDCENCYCTNNCDNCIRKDYSNGGKYGLYRHAAKPTFSPIYSYEAPIFYSTAKWKDYDAVENPNVTEDIWARPYSDYIETKNVFYQTSWFTKKISETNINYHVDTESCSDEKPLSTSTTKEYEYFDTDYSGRIISPNGYSKMGVGKENLFLEDEGVKQLQWTPSWQVYKTTETSGNITNITENFYVYDLVNHPDYQKNPNYADYRIIEGQDILANTVRRYKNRTLPYQTITTVSDGDSINSVSSYFQYITGLDIERPEPTIIVVENPNLDCDTDTDTGLPSMPCVFAWPTHIPDGYCESNIAPNIYCPCFPTAEIELEEGLVGGSSSDEYEDDIQAITTSLWNTENTGILVQDVPYVAGVLLHKVWKQTQASSTNQLVSFIDEGSWSIPKFPDDIAPPLLIKTVLGYNEDGLVTSIMDEKGIITNYEFSGGNVFLQYEECWMPEQTLTRRRRLSDNAGLPTKVTVGVGLDDFLETNYTYNLDNTLATITDPNDIELSYDYDNYGRMVGAYRNGKLIQETDYQIYPQTNPDIPFAAKARSNRVKTTNYTHPGIGFGSSGYIDPLGRSVGTFNFSVGGANPVTVRGEDVIYDIHNRPVVSLPPAAVSQPMVSGPMTDAASMETIYEIAPRSRPIRSSKYGLSINGPRVVNNAYCTVAKSFALDEIQATGKIQGLDFLTASSYLRTETSDEDDKSVVTFTNELGQTIATITADGTIATLFQYDNLGNVSKVSNAKEQLTSYYYNYFNQIKRKETVDAVPVHYAYDASGRLICTDDGGAIRVFKYDEFGRMTAQKSVESHYGLLDEDKDASPWVINRPLTALTNALEAGILEKSWIYHDLEGELVDNTNAAVSAKIANIENRKGAVVATVSYDLEENPIEYRFFSNNDDGFLDWEVTSFNSNGIKGTDADINTHINYPFYNFQGSPITQTIDLDCDDIKDFIYINHYDAWNRLKDVSIRVPGLGLNGQKIVEYNYDDILGVVKEKFLYSNCGNSVFDDAPIDEFTYTYDQRQRLTGITSNLMNYSLRYDGDASTYEGNWNGNINGTTVTYPMVDVANIPDNFQAGAVTNYEYKYDALNRLIAADGNVTGTGVFASNAEEFGDATYDYDKIGNLTLLTRKNNYSSNISSYNGDNLNYSYAPGTNKLMSAWDNDSIGHNMTYDNAGNLTSESFKNLSNFVYGRANLQYQVTTGAGIVNYLYDGNDSRVYKEIGGRKEYYLRNAAGQELLVWNLNNETKEWYIHGNDRVAKLADNTCLDGEGPGLSCRLPDVGCTGKSYEAQQASYVGIKLAETTKDIKFPTHLSKVVLCSGEAKWLLTEELKKLKGFYRITQQILLEKPEQVLTAEDTEKGTLYPNITLENLIRKRLTKVKGDILINGVQKCEEECIVKLAECTSAESEQQANSIRAIQDNFMRDVPAYVYESSMLLRIRLCGGREMYILSQMLEVLQGDFVILQQIPVDETTPALTATIDGGEARQVLPTKLGEDWLLNSKDVNIEGYVPCDDCEDVKPTCDEAGSKGQEASLENLTLITDPDYVQYPTQLFRVTLCSGEDQYFLREEMAKIKGNYLVKQQILVNDIYQRYHTYDGETGFEESYATLWFILNQRLKTKDFNVNHYKPCQAECINEFACEQGDSDKQMRSLTTIKQTFTNWNGSQLNSPSNLMRIRLCNGTEVYIFNWMLQGLYGNYTILQQIEILDAGQILDLDMPGQAPTTITTEVLSVQNYLLNDKIEPNINAYSPCYACTTDFPDCAKGENTEQAAVLDWLVGPEMPVRDNIGFPTRLSRVRFCTGEEYYLFKEELARVAGNYIVLQEISIETATTSILFQAPGQEDLVLDNPLVLINKRTKTPVFDIDNYENCGRTPDTNPDTKKKEQLASVAEIRMQMQETNPANYTLPAKLHRVRLYDNREINLFDQELDKLAGDYYIRSSMSLESHSKKVRVAIDGGDYEDIETDVVLGMRNAVNVIEFEKTGDDGGQSETDLGHFRLSFYVNDHLGNTRMVYHVQPKDKESDIGLEDPENPYEANCAKPEYVLGYVADYFPYGKVLREYVCSEAERYLTTQHERDRETGLDYRGARYYDADLGRFLSLDPLAADFAQWSPYNYVLGNPISLIDPDGREPVDPDPVDPPTKWETLKSGMSSGLAKAGRDFNELVVTPISNKIGELADAATKMKDGFSWTTSIGEGGESSKSYTGNAPGENIDVLLKPRSIGASKMLKAANNAEKISTTTKAAGAMLKDVVAGVNKMNVTIEATRGTITQASKLMDANSNTYGTYVVCNKTAGGCGDTISLSDTRNSHVKYGGSATYDGLLDTIQVKN